MIVHDRFYRMQVVIGHMNDIRRFRTEAVRVFRLTAHGHGEQRTSMERVVESDDFGFMRTVAGRCIITRQFECRFIGLGAGVHKHHALGEGGVDQLTRQAQCGFIRKHVADMPQRFALCF